MSVNPVLPPELAAQVAEAATGAEGYVPTLPTFTFRSKQWTIPDKPSANMLYEIEEDRLMHAIESILTPSAFAEFRGLDLDIDELEPFIDECNKAWGLTPGN